MSDKEVTEEAINDKLEEIMEKDTDRTIRLFAKLIFNLRFDLNDLKLELLKVLKDEGDCEVNHKEEEEDGKFYI